ncbi:MAG: 50S ribosomal protein L9 [Verrucomicrobiae bacterium]|nr:50S ribosomal protein L9 [Verrucomicrobiae bacterium]
MTTDVILLQPVKNLGAEGDKVTVASGYARNFLLPQRLATLATRSNIKQLETLKARRAAREAEELKAQQELADKIAKLTISIAVATGPGGKLFGAVTSSHIAEALAKEGIQVDHHQIEMKQPHHALGTFDVDIRLHPQVTANLKFSIVSKTAPGMEEAVVKEEKAKAKRPRPERGKSKHAEAGAQAKEAKPGAEGKAAKARSDEKKSEKRKER